MKTIKFGLRSIKHEMCIIPNRTCFWGSAKDESTVLEMIRFMWLWFMLDVKYDKEPHKRTYLFPKRGGIRV